jgi:hypothetical protein
MGKNDYYADHKKESYAFIVDGSDSMAIYKDRAGNMHIYVNPYESLGEIRIRDLVVGTIIHVYTHEGIHQSKRVTEPGQSMADIVEIMGWSDPPHRRPVDPEKIPVVQGHPTFNFFGWPIFWVAQPKSYDRHKLGGAPG